MYFFLLHYTQQTKTSINPGQSISEAECTSKNDGDSRSILKAFLTATIENPIYYRGEQYPRNKASQKLKTKFRPHAIKRAKNYAPNSTREFKSLYAQKYPLILPKQVEQRHFDSQNCEKHKETWENLQVRQSSLQPEQLSEFTEDVRSGRYETITHPQLSMTQIHCLDSWQTVNIATDVEENQRNETDHLEKNNADNLDIVLEGKHNGPTETNHASDYELGLFDGIYQDLSDSCYRRGYENLFMDNAQTFGWPILDDQ